MIVLDHAFKYKLILFCFYLGLQSHFLAAQNQNKGSGNIKITENRVDTIYGLDQLLYNGKQYTFFKSETILGNQFLIDDNYLEGNVVIKGVHYLGLSVNFDIYNQQLLLKYEDINGYKKIIIASKAWLDGFTLKVKEPKQILASKVINQTIESSLKEMDFMLISTPEFPQRIYQVIGRDSIKILFFWKKNLTVSNFSTDGRSKANYVFSDAIKEQFVKMGDKIVKYKNSRRFILMFDPPKQGLIRNYLKEHKINFKKASDQAILDLITYCNNI